MKPIVESMAGQGIRGRMEAMKQLQEGGLFNPGNRGPRVKKGTGKRLSPKEKAKLKKQREKEMRRRKRSGSQQDEG